jgi:dTDP-4-dehydrorhamnose 3,5-epimerase
LAEKIAVGDFMKFEARCQKSSSIDGVFEFIPDTFEDHRGAIWTSYHSDLFDSLLPDSSSFKHDKFVSNKKNVLRGLHGDQKTFKLVMCPYGEVYQVALDVRQESSSYGGIHVTNLNGENKRMLLIPPGVANGFLVLSEYAIYHYKLSYRGEYLDADDQFTIKYNDPRFGVSWPMEDVIISNRDAEGSYSVGENPKE